MPGSAAPTEPGWSSSLTQRAGDDRRRLGQPVALVDRDAGALGELLDHLRRQRRRAGQHQPHRAEPLLELVDAAPVGEDRRRDRHDAARLVLDQVEGALRVEPSASTSLARCRSTPPSTALRP